MKLPAISLPSSVDPLRAVEWLAWWFYAVAALGSSIGQIWAMAIAPAWSDTIPVWIRAAAVTPFAIVIDLAGVVTSAFADARRRLGEPAHGWRALSLCSVTIAVGINIAGHRDALQFAIAFGFLGILAYAIWLLHSSARRRDALRAAGKLADTAPVYGLWQWCKEFEVTRQARQLALAHGLGLHESLTTAREQIRTTQRNKALAGRIEAHIRAQHNDPIRADIAATTPDLDALAQRVAALFNIDAWATTIAADLNPPPTNTTTNEIALADDTSHDEPDDDESDNDTAAPHRTDARMLPRVPVVQADYDRWRELWDEMSAAKLTNREMAQRHQINMRKLQHIRKAGTLGLLDSPLPPTRPAPPEGDHLTGNGKVTPPGQRQDPERPRLHVLRPNG